MAAMLERLERNHSKRCNQPDFGSAGMPFSGIPADFSCTSFAEKGRKNMRKYRTPSLLLAVVCVLCLSIQAAAYGVPSSGRETERSPYGTPQTDNSQLSENPYYGYDPSFNSNRNQNNSNPNRTPSGNPGTRPNGNTGGMPGKDTPSGNNTGGMPGRDNPSGGMGGAGSGGGTNYGTGGATGGGVSGDHFSASIGSDGSIAIGLPNATGVSANDPSSAFKTIFDKYKGIGIAITGICVITAILSMLFQITKLGAAGDNERLRTSAMKGIIYSGAVLAAFGSLALVIGFFWNAFNG